MVLDRRVFLAGLVVGTGAAGVVGAHAEGSESWFPIKSDDGRLVPNRRLPVELTEQLTELPGIIWIGAAQPEVTLVEVFDFNCPWCHKAAADVERLLKKNPHLRVGLLNNPILSPMSAQAAKVELAVLKLKGPQTAFAFHQRMFERRGRRDGLVALDVAEAMKLPRQQIEETADSDAVRGAMRAQMKLAESLGLSATPSFLLAGMGILGYPGSKSLAAMVSATASCGEVMCKG